MLPKQQHDAVVAHDLAAHDLVELPLQVRKLARKLFQLMVGDDADLGVLERHGIAGVAVGADAVQAEQFAGHLEAGDLVAAILGGHAGLEEAGAHGVQRRKGLAGMEQALAAFDAAAGADHVVQRHHFVVRQAHRQTEFAQVAGRTGDLQCIDAGRWGGFMRHVGHYCIRNNSKN
jgi:hypothetical protein